MAERKRQKTVTINRAPVLTLWAAVVAERLGFGRLEALTLGRAVAGLNAQSKGRRLGIFHPSEESAKQKRDSLKEGEELRVGLLGREVRATRTKDGLRALSKDKPTDPESVERYLSSKFGDALDDAREAMKKLARSMPKDELADKAYELYEDFRPSIPAGTKGWGAKGRLDLERIRKRAEG
jgi:hypothetical protein